jgi:hypothetical protein
MSELSINSKIEGSIDGTDLRPPHPPQLQRVHIFREMSIGRLPPRHHFTDAVRINLNQAAALSNTEGTDLWIEQVLPARVPHDRGAQALTMAHYIAFLGSSV